MHHNRPLEIAAFLEQHGWGDAVAAPFDGDFSPRRYARLTRADGTTAILMDADADQKTPQFVRLAKILRDHGVHAPEIYAALPDQGLVLLQDFGTRNVGALIDAGDEAKPYFLRAAEILAHLHKNIIFQNTLFPEEPVIGDLGTGGAAILPRPSRAGVGGGGLKLASEKEFRCAVTTGPHPLPPAREGRGSPNPLVESLISQQVLPIYSTNYFIPQVDLFLDAYVPYAKNREASAAEREDFRASWRAVLRPIEAMPKSLMLRDFMADNLMDISQMVGMKKKNDVRENSLSPIGGEGRCEGGVRAWCFRFSGSRCGLCRL